MLTLKVKVQLSWYGYLSWLRLRLSLSNRTGLSECAHSEGQDLTELVLFSFLVEVEGEDAVEVIQ